MISWDTIATILTVLGSITSLAYWMGKKFTRFEERLNKFEVELNSFREELKRLRSDITTLTRFSHSFIPDFLSVKGLITKEEREFALREIDRLSKAYTRTSNPLKPEEAQFIREVIEEIRRKDPKEVDMKKVEKALEILDRWFWEDRSEDAYRAWFYMYLVKRSLEKERGEI